MGDVAGSSEYEVMSYTFYVHSYLPLRFVV